MNVSWLSITALQAGLTLADALLQCEVFVNTTGGTSYPKADFPNTLKSKKQFHLRFDIFYFEPWIYDQTSNCCVIIYVAPRTKRSEGPDLHGFWRNLSTRKFSANLCLKELLMSQKSYIELINFVVKATTWKLWNIETELSCLGIASLLYRTR